MATKAKAKAKKPVFCLVRWVEEDSVGVMPITSVNKGQKATVGTIAEFKYSGRFYEAEVLKNSEDRQLLMQLCDKLVKMIITPEDLMKGDESEVDSTTEESPVKKKPRVELKSKKSVALAKISAAKVRANEIFGCMDVESGDEVADLRKQVEDLKKKLCSTQPSAPKRMQPTINVTKNVVSNSQFDSLQKSILHSSDNTETEDFGDDFSLYDSDPYGQVDTDPRALALTPRTLTLQTPIRTKDTDPRTSSTDEYKSNSTPNRKNWKDAGTKPSNSSTSTPNRKNWKGTSASNGLGSEDQVFKVQPKPIELVEGYGVFIMQRQLDAAVDAGATSPTRLIRSLMNCFFKPEVLSVSTAYGSRGKTALDEDIVAACIRFVQLKFPNVARTVMIDAINDKCNNYRRRTKK